MRIAYVPSTPAIPAIFKAYGEDAGFDLFAIEDRLLWPFQTARVPVNLAVDIPPGHFGWVTGRSGKSSLGLLVHAGIIDAGYTGQIQVVMTNVGVLPRKIRRGDRIAQLVVLSLPPVDFEEVVELPDRKRGARGFGSSGS